MTRDTPLKPVPHPTLSQFLAYSYTADAALQAMKVAGVYGFVLCFLAFRKVELPTRPALEVVLPLLLWSWVFEVWLPGIPACQYLMVGDPNDILCYGFGAIGAMLFWERFYEVRAKGDASPHPHPGSSGQ